MPSYDKIGLIGDSQCLGLRLAAQTALGGYSEALASGLCISDHLGYSTRSIERLLHWRTTPGHPHDAHSRNIIGIPRHQRRDELVMPRDRELVLLQVGGNDITPGDYADRGRARSTATIVATIERIVGSIREWMTTGDRLRIVVATIPPRGRVLDREKRAAPTRSRSRDEWVHMWDARGQVEDEVNQWIRETYEGRCFDINQFVAAEDDPSVQAYERTYEGTTYQVSQARPSDRPPSRRANVHLLETGYRCVWARFVADYVTEDAAESATSEASPAAASER